MKRLTLALACSAALFAALPAHAQFQKPEDAVKYRKAAFTLMANHFGRLSAMAQGKAPFDAASAAANAELVASLAKLPFTAFGEGTAVGDTAALPEVWSQNDKFKAAAAKLGEATTQLAAAGKSGNLDQIKAAVGETGKTCKACHDNFKKK